MIRRSMFVAVVAVLVSLFVHLFALTFTGPGTSGQPEIGGKPDAVELSTTFEDFVEAPSEPVQADYADIPEPTVEDPIETERSEVPISDAQVASTNPQQVSSPDAGSPEPVQPDASEATAQTAEIVSAGSEAPVEPPLQPETVPENTETLAETQPVTAPEVTEPEQIAALPTPEAPVAPEEADTADTEELDVVVEPEPGEIVVDENQGSEQAVTASIRPRLPTRQQQALVPETLKGTDKFENLRFPKQTIDSPLAVYSREGVDAFKQSSGEDRAEGRGGGNAKTTNYAGQVLVHLNRAPVVRVPKKGYAQVFFEINPDGSLAWVDVVDSSGSPEIERAAKEQVRAAAPFPRPPDGISKKLSFYYQIS